MKRWKKWLLIALAAVLLAPWFWTFASDGGSYTFASPLYQVTRYHSMVNEPGEYWVGTSISIFGIEVYSTGLRLVWE